jgi:tRNA(fMet)-specific endonuclease VapC
MKFLLDSNVFIHSAKNMGNVRTRLKSVSPSILTTSVVTLAELLYGASKSPEPERAQSSWLAALSPFQLLDFDELSAHQHARIRQLLRHKPIGERDLLIASIALANDLVIVTHNAEEFCRVPGLKVEDWF